MRATIRPVVVGTATLALIAAAAAPAQAAPAAQGQGSVSTQAQAANQNPNAASVNAFVRGLNYDPRLVLASPGESVTSVPPTQGTMEGGTFTVLERTKKNLSTSGSDISTISAGATAAYPGALVLTDQNLLDSRPTVLGVDRRPVNVSVDLPGLGQGENSIKVNQPSRSSVNGAVNTLLKRWSDGPGKSTEQPARFQYSEATAYSSSQLAAKFGYSFKQVGSKLGIDFEAVNKGKKQTMVASFKQIFYTASVDEPRSPDAVFGRKVTAQDLKDRGVSAQTPPSYVSSVDYGRQIYVKLETSSSSTKVKAAFDAAIKGHTAEASLEVKKVLKDTNFSALVVGGSSSGHVHIVNGKAEELKAVINNLSVYSPKNPGVPISYTVKFLKDNAQGVVNNTTEYVETRARKFTSGKVTLRTTGSYVARFNLTWDEVSYDGNGKKIVTPKAWNMNGNHFTQGWRTSVPLPANAVNISVKAEEATGLAWEPWRTLVDEKNLPLTHDRIVWIGGGTLTPNASVEVPKLPESE